MVQGSATVRLEDIPPPNSPESEAVALGAMLHDNAFIDWARAEKGLTKDDFYQDANRVIFEHIAREHDAGRRVDLVLLAEGLKERGLLEAAGRHAHLAEVWESCGSSIGADRNVEVVRDYALRRRLAGASWESLRLALKPTCPAEEALERSEQLIFALRQTRQQAADEERHVSEIVGEVYDRVNARLLGKTERGLQTGLAGLDMVLAGLQKSELVIVAARPSVGKTTLGMAFAIEAALLGRKQTLFVSLEQPRAELIERAICAVAGVDSQRVKLGKLTQEESGRFTAAGDRLRDAPLIVSDLPNQRVSRIAARARRMGRRQGLDLLLVDYLQLVEPEDRRQPRQEQVATMSRRLKLLARELAVPVVVMAQLNRESERREGQKPKLCDLRESGAIEADADVVLLLHRPDRDSHDLLVQVEKNRNGPTGDVTLRHHKSTGRVTDPADTPFE